MKGIRVFKYFVCSPRGFRDVTPGINRRSCHAENPRTFIFIYTQVGISDNPNDKLTLRSHLHSYLIKIPGIGMLFFGMVRLIEYQKVDLLNLDVSIE